MKGPQKKKCCCGSACPGSAYCNANCSGSYTATLIDFVNGGGDHCDDLNGNWTASGSNCVWYGITTPATVFAAHIDIYCYQLIEYVVRVKDYTTIPSATDIGLATLGGGGGESHYIEGSDWYAATSNQATAQSVKDALDTNGKVLASELRDAGDDVWEVVCQIEDFDWWTCDSPAGAMDLYITAYQAEWVCHVIGLSVTHYEETGELLQISATFTAPATEESCPPASGLTLDPESECAGGSMTLS